MISNSIPFYLSLTLGCGCWREGTLLCEGESSVGNDAGRPEYGLDCAATAVWDLKREIPEMFPIPHHSNSGGGGEKWDEDILHVRLQ